MELTRIATRAAFLSMATWLAASSAGAQDHPPPAEQAAHEASEAPGEEHFHRNALGIVIGGTYESEEEDTFFTLGVEYERLFSPRFALVLGVEYISEVDAVVLVAPFVYRHGNGWRLSTGPGLELKTRRQEPEREHGGELDLAAVLEDSLTRKEENLFLWRFGIGYTFEIGERLELAPSVNLDLVRESGHWVQAVVFVVAIGFGF